MSQRTLTAASGVPAAGTITFYDASRAPLSGGAVTLTVTQSVELPPEFDDPLDYTQTQQLRVDAPRFQLQPADVQSVFPPGNHLGSFAEALPHVILSRDLPWARPIVPVDTTGPLEPLAPVPPSPPWLALLVVHEAEVGLVSGPVVATVNELVHPGAGVVPPDLPGLTAAELGATCQVLTMDLALFQQIVPTLDELALLVHARQVDTTRKVTNLVNGFWSVVVANRLPDASADGPRDSTVYLVSVEGHQQHLHGATVTGGTRIALAALASWKFTTSAFPGDFLGLLQSIGNRGQDRVLLMPTVPPTTAPAALAAAQEAIALGFVPLANDLRTGEQTTSWYRGPVTPFPTRPDPIDTTWTVSDQAIRYDPENGLFDHSYACAWQVGRLLGLSDSGFVQAMVAWRRQVVAEATAQVTATRIAPDVARSGPMRPGDAMSAFSRALGGQELPKRQRRVARNLARRLSALDGDDFRRRVSAGEDPLELLLSTLSRTP